MTQHPAIALAKELLTIIEQELTPVRATNHPLTRLAILDEVARATGVPARSIRGRCRTRPCSRARSVVCHVIRHFDSDITNHELGVLLGNRDPSTIHGLRKNYRDDAAVTQVIQAMKVAQDAK